MAKTVLIAGANRGIGLALVEAFAARGDRVTATCRAAGRADALAALAGRYPGLTVREADVTDPESLAAAAEAHEGPLDTLVCNAGRFLARGPLENPDQTPEAWREVLMTNVAGVFFTVRAFLPALEQAAAPRIAVISSIMGSSERAPGGSVLYRASKAAATNLARNLAAELAGRGIAVGAYHPGWVRTDMGGDAAPLSAEESVSAMIATIDALSAEQSGKMVDRTGEPLPW
jgi:NAD(P)-dependent dehydrogenase (short-subunit alcohol dehydrogenase family)